MKKFNRKEIDAKVTFRYITIFCAAEVISSAKLSLNTIILTNKWQFCTPFKAKNDATETSH